MKFLRNRQHFFFSFLSKSPIQFVPLPSPSFASQTREFHIPDLDLVQASLCVLIHVDVDGEMCVDVAHLVLEALGDTDDQVVDDRAYCTESGDIFASTVV